METSEEELIQSNHTGLTDGRHSSLERESDPIIDRITGWGIVVVAILIIFGRGLVLTNTLAGDALLGIFWGVFFSFLLLIWGVCYAEHWREKRRNK
jgi:hypothetical protein